MMSKNSGNAINVYVGQRIKIRRRSLGYTLDDIALKTGISSQMCSKYERGAVQIPPHALIEISSVLSISVNLLFPENPNLLSFSLQKHTDIASVSTMSLESYSDLYCRKETVDLVEAFYRLPTLELRRIIRAMVRTVAAELPRAATPLGPE